MIVSFAGALSCAPAMRAARSAAPDILFRYSKLYAHRTSNAALSAARPCAPFSTRPISLFSFVIGFNDRRLCSRSIGRMENHLLTAAEPAVAVRKRSFSSSKHSLSGKPEEGGGGVQIGGVTTAAAARVPATAGEAKPATPSLVVNTSDATARQQHTNAISLGTAEASNKAAVEGVPSPPPSSPDHNPHRIWTVPNALTGLRMALSPVVAYQIVSGDFVSAAWTLAGAAFLDWADGWVARTWNQGSLLGSFLDPLSDKMLVACTGLALGWVGVLPIPLLILIVGRDALLVGGSFYFRAKTKRPDEAFFGLSTVDWKVEPSTLSKANTALQLLLVLAGVGHAGWALPPAEVITALSWTVAGTTLASGWGYWKQAGLATRPGMGATAGGGASGAYTGLAARAKAVQMALMSPASRRQREVAAEAAAKASTGAAASASGATATSSSDSRQGDSAPLSNKAPSPHRLR